MGRTHTLWHHRRVTGSISEWQRRLDLDATVTLRWPMWRIVWYIGGGLLIAGAGAALLAHGVVTWWAICFVALFPLGILWAVWGLIIRGVPSVTVTRTGLTVRRRREVSFEEIHELITNSRTFGVVWTPGPGDELRGRWQRKHGLKYASVPAEGVADPELLAQWVLHLADPSGEILVEPRSPGMGKTWRLRN
jgi:hypothetical protein